MASIAALTAHIQGTYKGEFISMTDVALKGTSKPDKYGAVVHTLSAHTTWNDGSQTWNEFRVHEQADGELD
jgi:hypothetical protein